MKSFHFRGRRYAVVVLDAPGSDELTAAERDILGGILRGESAKAIATRRRRSLRTVQNQIYALMKKVGVRSRIELVRALRARPN